MKLRTGEKVEHSQYGVGRVVRTEKKGVVIEFPAQPNYFLTWDAIKDKLIPYYPVKTGDYVYHPIRGVGKVENATPEDGVDVSFKREKVKGMAWSIAEKLETIPADGIRAALYDDEEKVKTMMEENPTELIALVLIDCNREAKTDEIKRLLIQQKLLKLQDWDKWWKSATPKLREDPHFDTSLSQKQIYRLREKPKPLYEEIYERFQQQDNFEEKYRTIKTLIDEHFTELDDTSKSQIHSYLSNTIVDENIDTAFRVEAYFLAERLAQKSEKHGVPAAGEQLFDQMIDISKLFYTADAERVLNMVKDKSRWVDIYISALDASAVRIRKTALKMLVKAEKWDELNLLLDIYIEQLSENPELCVWFINELLTHHLKKAIQHFDVKRILERFLDYLKETRSDKKNKYREKIYTLVVDHRILTVFIGENSDEIIEKFLERYLTSDSIRIHDQEQVMDILETQNRMHIMEKLAHYFEDAIQLRKNTEKQKVSAEEYEEMQTRFENLLMEELPRITREMAATRDEKGEKDSHYLALWDKQRFILTQIQRVKEIIKMSEVA